jgi:hypothetical protein
VIHPPGGRGGERTVRPGPRAENKWCTASLARPPEQVIADERLPATRREAVDACRRYLTGHLDQLHYDTALDNGWPIATGAVEGSCRHLIADRLDITGARWGLHGAEALLRLRTVVANGDLDAYWRFHTAHQDKRLYPTPDQQDYNLTA